MISRMVTLLPEASINAANHHRATSKQTKQATRATRTTQPA